MNDQSLIAENAALKKNHSFFNTLVMRLASLPAGEDIAPLLTSSIRKHTNAVIAILCHYDACTGIMHAKHIDSKAAVIKQTAKLLGKEIFSTKAQISKDIYHSLKTNIVTEYDSLSGITFCATPTTMDTVIKNVIGVDIFYGVSHVFNNKLFGTTLLAFMKNQPKPGTGLLEGYANLAAVSLRRNIAEKRLNELLTKFKHYNLQLGNLNLRQMEEKEKEREMIVQLLHEETGQTLTSLKLDIGWLMENINNQDACIERLKKMNTVIHNSTGIIQGISRKLRPGVLEIMGFKKATERLAAEYKRKSIINIHLNLDDCKISKNHGISLFRILEEAIENTIKHAQAYNIYISLQQSNKGLYLIIEDDGIGISKQIIDSEKSLGFIQMGERAKMLGGKLTITSTSGTKINVFIPHA